MNSKLTLFLIFLITLSTYKSSCEEGCLSCKKNKCITCDQNRDYIFRKGKCVTNPVKNCEEYVGEMCVVCKADHFVDTDVNRCVSLVSSDKVKDCLTYSVEKQCSGCKKGFYLKSDFSCGSVGSKIENCDFYRGESVCDECGNGFSLRLRGKSCQENPVVGNCLVYSTAGCLECEGNKIMEKNYVNYVLFQKLKSNDNALIRSALKNYNKKGLTLENSCLTPTVENCATFISFDSCKACNSGYFLKDGKCYPYPKEVIPSCSIYLKENECKQCQPGFFLKNATECSPIVPILKCELYNPKADETICTKCWNLYFLKSNKCEERKNLSDLCDIYEVSEDKCQTCRENYTTTSDGKHCLKSVANCETYVASTFETESLTCEQCKPLYFLENVNECVKGTIPFCWIYQIDKNFCNECTSKHWTNNGACIAHELVSECLVYDKTTQDTCIDCQAESMLMEKTTKCSPVFIEGCETYASFENCASCKDGYDKVNSFECKALDAGSNCLRADAGNCVQCQINFVLIDNKCKRPYKYEVELCDQTNIDGNLNDHNSVHCNLCLEGTFPYNYKDSYVCVENDEVEILLSSDLVPDCLGYEKINETYYCTRCVDNKVLKNGACVNNCGANTAVTYDTPLKRFIFEDDGSGKQKLKNLDLCEEDDNNDKCKVKSFQFNGNIFVDVCVDDKKDKLKVVTLNDINYIILKKEDLNLKTNSENLFKRSFYTYTILDTVNLKSTSSVSERAHMLENCDYFYGLPNGDTGCLNCRFGQFGRILNWKVDNCHTYENSSKKCTKCVHGYYPTDSNLKCSKINIPECIRFSHTAAKCLLCKNLFFVNSNNFCDPISVVENCEFYRTHLDSCGKCNKDYILNDSNNKCLLRLDHCIDHDKTFTTGPLECIKCKDGFYIGNFGLCECKNLIQNCWRYKQLKGNSDCEYYNNAFEFKIQNYCIKPTLKKNCAYYSDSSTCSKCVEGYYLSSSLNCVRLRHVDSDGAGTESPITILNCLNNTTDTNDDICTECIEGYYLDTINKKCCQYGSFWDVSGSKCQERALISKNEMNCGVWDRFIHRCIACKDNYYRNSLGNKCCPDTEYLVDSSTCATLADINDDCLYSNDTTGNKCLKCADTHFLRDGHCCDTDTKYWNGTACAVYLTDFPNCKIFSKDNKQECVECNTGHYFAFDDKCCSNNSGSEEYSVDGIDCIVVPTSPTKIINNCIEYNSDIICKKCSSFKVISDSGNKCCDNEKTWINNGTSQACIENELIFANCLALDPYDINNNREILCNKCEEKFYLSENNCVAEKTFYNSDTPDNPDDIDDDNCLEGNNDVCNKCKENYYYDQTSTQCCPHNTIYDTDDCYSIQISKLNIAFSKSNSSVCEENEDIITYYSGLRCCPQGQYSVDSYTCDDITTPNNCIQSTNNSGNCTKCKTGFHVNADTCVGDIDNCENTTGASGSEICDDCIKGFIISADNTCSDYKETVKDCSHPFTTNLCQIANFDDSDVCECTTCGPLSYKDGTNNKVCCPFGYTYHATNGCTKILNNKYCAKYDGDYTECETCFSNLNYCTTSSNHDFSIKKLIYSANGTISSGGPIEFNQGYNNIEFNYLGSDTKKCCPLGKYWNGSLCECISNIPNCLKYENNKCTKCKDEYKEDDGNCCKYNEIYDTFYRTCIIKDSEIKCPEGQYKSNDHCCDEHNYWDLNLDRCMQLFDNNCLESNSKSTCKKCDENYALDTYKYIINLNFETLENCINPNERFIIQFCILQANLGLSYDKIRTIADDCAQFDSSFTFCKECMTNTYKTTQNSFCCKDNYFGYKNKCRLLENLVKNCENYNHLTRECLKCSDSYHLSNGVCCLEGTFLNTLTMNCDNIDLNCKIFDVDAGLCTECDNTKYFTNGNCCDFHYYYDKSKKKCVAIIGSGLKDSCEKLDDFGTCQKCSLDFYLHKKHCCEPGYFWNGKRNTCQSELCEDIDNKSSSETDDNGNNCNWYWEDENKLPCTTGDFSTSFDPTDCCGCGGGLIEVYKTENCKYFGYFNDCVECKDGYYFNNLKCCPHGTFWDTTDLVCKTDFEFVGCKEFNDAGSACISCSDSYYLSNAHCCLDLFYWDTTLNKCSLINKKYHENCSEIDTSDFETCLICDTNYYKSDSKHCCMNGEWWNKDLEACEIIGLNDCSRTSDNINCDLCSKSTEISFKLFNDSTDEEFIFSCQTATNKPINCAKASGVADTENTCLICKDNFWKPDSGKCCPYGNGNTGDCTSPLPNNCSIPNPADVSQCVTCISGYIQISSKCVKLGTDSDFGEHYNSDTSDPVTSTASDCKLGKTGTDASLCQICLPGYTLGGDDICSQNSGGNASITCGLDSSGDCNSCISSEYLDTNTNKCCASGMFYLTSKSECVSLDDYLINLSTYCLEFDNSKCIKCNSETYLSHNGRCCQTNFYDNQISCVERDEEGLKFCKQYANISLCKMTTSDEKTPMNREASCLKDNSTIYYFNHDHCCPLGKYWNELINKCNLINDVLLNSNCEKVDEEHLCIQCEANYYISNGYCCLTNTFKKKTSNTCENILRDKCSQRSNTKCKLCSSGNIDSIHDECCDTQYFSSSAQVCLNKPSNCDDVDEAGDCLSCITDSYLSNKRCCPQRQHWDGNQCSTQNIPENCLEISDYDTSDTGFIILCSLCDNFKVRNGKCCGKDELFFLDLGCMKTNLIIGSCIELNDDGTCMKCNSNFYVSSGACCPNNYSLDTTVSSANFLTCQIINNSENCKQKSGNQCILCESTYYLNSFITNKKCCKIGMPHQDTSICSTNEDDKVDDCVEFEENENIKKCKTCRSGYNLYIYETNNRCCADGKFFNKEEEKCDLIQPKPLNCNQFSLKDMKCLKCKTNFILVDGNCCADGSFWHRIELKCLPITYTNCKRQDYEKCMECDDSFYLENNGCCKIQHHWDDSKKICVENADKLCYQYNKGTEKCTKCDDTSGAKAYLYDDHCCFSTFVWDSEISSCKRLIQNCKEYQKIGDDWLCKECTGDFKLSDDKTSCCANGTFFIKDAPYERQCVIDPLIDKFLVTCMEYDEKNINCIKCGENHYESNGVCCPYGKYKITTESYKCTDIPLGNQKCTEFNGNKCTSCDEGYKLNNTNICVKIKLFCVQEHFDADTEVCSECMFGKYISNNNCCDEGSWFNSSCEVIDNSQNCLNQNVSGECKKCKEEFYIVSNKCCKNSKFCTANNVPNGVLGKIKNCQQYSVSDINCVKCDDLYHLVTLLNGKKFCYPIPKQENCDTTTIDVDTENKLLCSKCDDQTFLVSYESYQPFYEHFYHQNESCVGFKNKYLVSNSSLECLKCKEVDFLNVNSCDMRNNNKNCLVYDLEKDECLQCTEDQWLDENDGSCKDHNNPNTACKYFNDNKCELCKDNNGSSDFWRIYDGVNWPTCKLETVYDGDDVEANDPSLWPGYIYKCRKNFECSDEYLNGLSIELEKFVSCHKCNDSDKIPFVSLMINDDSNSLGGLQKYMTTVSNTNNLNEFTDDNVNFSNQCLYSNLSEFDLVGINNFDLNCGIGIINSTLKADTSESNSATPASNKLGIYCGACKPGFKATVTTSSKVFYVESCDIILNCQLSGTAFNQCDKCKENYTFNYTSSNGIDRSTCVDVSSNKHCYAFNDVNDECIICKKGYSLNPENICELLDAPFCEGKKMAKNSFLPRKDYELIIFRGIIGCQKCSSGFSGIFKTENEFICTQSPYLKKGNFISNNPAFNQHCLQYGLDNDIIYCQKCKENYVATIKNSDLNNIYGRCLNKTGKLENCLKANNDLTCNICETSHTLVDSSCVLKEISNCHTYSNTLNVLTCTVCNNYYYLNSNECVLGKITDCLTYESQTSCNQCKTGYQRVNTKDGKHYCIPVTTHENCLQFHDSDFQNLKLTCNKCESGFLLEVINNPDDYKKICNRIQLVPFCSKYDKESTFETSTFNCLECHQGYFLENNSCQQRLLTLPNCLTYSIKSDTCASCENEYYLNQSNTECLINPSGITGCAIFSNDDSCVSCKSSYYPIENKCEIVPTNNLINDCIQYSDSKTCSTCFKGKALDNNECKDPEVQNCEVYTTTKSCFRCIKDYGLKTSGDLKLCEPLPIISNCNTVTTEYPFECSKCLDGYYLETNTITNIKECNPANPLIPNCKEYSSNDQCSRCNKDYIVSADNKSCFKYKTNTNCISYKEEENPFCVLCAPGYKLNSKRECVILSTDPKKGIAANPGCALFNFYDSAICEICLSNHYMDDKGICNKILTEKEKNDATNRTTTPDGVINKQKKYIDITFAKYGVMILALLSFLG